MLRRIEHNELAQVLVTFGLLLMISDLSIWIWGGLPRTLPRPEIFDGAFRAGGGSVAIVAGPCAVEGRASLDTTARRLRELGIVALRAGAYKPRTSVYSFQGLGEAGLELLAQTRRSFGMAIVTEVVTPEEVPMRVGR